MAELAQGKQNWVQLLLNGQPFSALPSLNDTGQCLVDIESCPNHDALLTAMTYTHRHGLAALRQLADVPAVAQAACELIRNLDLDKVMIYRFDAQWNGEVIAEAAADGVEPYLGLNFPASDIPKQARDLFRLCRVRIPDVCYTPSALITRGEARSIDLGRIQPAQRLPIHLEYLKNMGARATLVGALVVADLGGWSRASTKTSPRCFWTRRNVMCWAGFAMILPI